MQVHKSYSVSLTDKEKSKLRDYTLGQAINPELLHNDLCLFIEDLIERAFHKGLEVNPQNESF